MSHCCHNQGKPTEILSDEHKVIMRLIAVLRKAVERLEGGENVSPDVFRNAVDFIRTFADKCHHGKEQDTLFPIMVQRGVPQEGGPIGVMLIEHDQGRAFTRELAEAAEAYASGYAAARARIVAAARNYADLLTQHIYKEDNVLYPMANRFLTDEDQQQLKERFDAVETSMGEGTHEKYLALVAELEEIVGR